jgi:hypothetical protein
LGPKQQKSINGTSLKTALNLQYYLRSNPFVDGYEHSGTGSISKKTEGSDY